ncbi:MAG TPA: ATP-binding protein, partial [Vicinamibacterales bacterium]|nr:ATP-binding protein [Vicinamibacterales bacterium]
TYRQEVAQLEGGTQTMAATVAAYVNRTFAVADAVADVLIAEPSIQTLDAGAASGALRSVLGNRLFRNAVIADRTGHPIVWATPPDPGVEGTMPAGWLGTAALTGSPSPGRLLGGVEAPERAVLLTYPIRHLGQTVGVLGLSIRQEALEEGLASLPVPRPAVITIVDGGGTVVARNRNWRPLAGQSFPLALFRALASHGPAAVRSSLDGDTHISAGMTIPRGHWTVSVGVPTSTAWALTMLIYRRNFRIVAGGTIVILFIEFVFARRWLRAVSHLERAAGRVKDGDLTIPDRQPMPTSELEDLQDAFTSMVAGLRQARAAIAAQVDEERRMRTELQSLQQQLIRQERLAAIGVLAAGLAHELNNPLQAVLGLAELLMLRGDLPADAGTDLRLIAAESQRASAIVRNLKRFGQPQTAEPSAVRLHDVITSTVELRRHDIEGQDIELRIDDRATAPVLAVFTELQQVLLNFVINAEQAITADGAGPRRIEIRTSEQGGRVRVEVEDTGPGVAPHDVSKLFQPFFTTKPVGEGTGLGLSVSYGIIQGHGGEIGYRPSETGGAVFYFELPAAAV